MTGMLLEGVKVIELGQNLAGPFAGEILADLGATVVKVEKPEGGDDARRWGPPVSDDASAAFHAMNRNKLSVVLDLTIAEDRQKLERLIAESDMLIHNLRPGVMHRLGLGPAETTARHPRLIYCDMGAFGHVGPLKDRPGYEPLMQAFSGLISANGHPDGPPARLGASVVDLGTGMWTVIGALAALFRRGTTGTGCVINTSLFETALLWCGFHLVTYMTGGGLPVRHGTGHPLLVPYQAFETANGPLVIAAGNDRLFKRLAEVLGHPEWGTDPRFLTNEDRSRNRDVLLPMVAEAVAGCTKEDLSERLEAAGMPCAPIHTVDEVLAHPQTQALEILQQAPGMDLRLVGMPISFDGERPAHRKNAPALGEDTDDIFRVSKKGQ
ncbi:CoA transferase [Mesorhizobium sp. CAU 1741]|uniref:CaiB/BaiF CoA transferase family protein n=1 Tax=Mesorhizobium sp. CAU 1741 TaxID=3140366 RepID=UPI00325AB700